MPAFDAVNISKAQIASVYFTIFIFNFYFFYIKLLQQYLYILTSPQYINFKLQK